MDWKLRITLRMEITEVMMIESRVGIEKELKVGLREEERMK